MTQYILTKGEKVKRLEIKNNQCEYLLHLLKDGWDIAVYTFGNADYGTWQIKDKKVIDEISKIINKPIDADMIFIETTQFHNDDGSESCTYMYIECWITAKNPVNFTKRYEYTLTINVTVKDINSLYFIPGQGDASKILDLISEKGIKQHKDLLISRLDLNSFDCQEG